MKPARIFLSVILLLLGWVATLQAQVPELLNLAGHRMPDPEFDHFGYQVTWQDENDNLWVAPVNRRTGDIEIAQAKHLAEGLAPNAPLSSGLATGNGPEWVQTATGGQILYTLQVGPLGPQNWRVGVAEKTNNVWHAAPLNDPDSIVGGAPDGTKVGNDGDPLINIYFQARSGERKLAWGHLNNPAIGGVAPFEFASPARWALGGHFLVSTIRQNRINQVVFFDPAAPNTYVILTDDRAFSKSKPQMWWAPEFRDFVFFALENRPGREPKQIGLYRLIDGEWTKFKTIAPPSGRNFQIIDSPESFVYKGHSYIVMAMTSRTSRRTEIWIAGIEEQDFYLKVADGIESTDPEYLITDAGLFIYLSQNDGRQVYRAATGL